MKQLTEREHLDLNLRVERKLGTNLSCFDSKGNYDSYRVSWAVNKYRQFYPEDFDTILNELSSLSIWSHRDSLRFSDKLIAFVNDFVMPPRSFTTEAGYCFTLLIPAMESLPSTLTWFLNRNIPETGHHVDPDLDDSYEFSLFDRATRDCSDCHCFGPSPEIAIVRAYLGDTL